MKTIDIILDPAHGEDVAGKRSPDGLHREYLWSRARCKSLDKKLKTLGYKVEWTNTSNKEIGLNERIKIGNLLALKEKTKSLLISIHNDATKDEWDTVTGYSAYTSPGQTKSDEFSQILLLELKKQFPELKMRKDEIDGDLDKEENFAVLKGGNYSAILVEWLFQNNKEDLKKINDPSYIEKFEQCIINAIEKWK